MHVSVHVSVCPVCFCRWPGNVITTIDHKIWLRRDKDVSELSRGL